jgi:hypothetical protein
MAPTQVSEACYAETATGVPPTWLVRNEGGRAKNSEQGIPEIARTEVEERPRITKAVTEVPRYEKSMLRRSYELIRNLEVSHRGPFVSASVNLGFFFTSILATSGIHYLGRDLLRILANNSNDNNTLTVDNNRVFRR